MAIGSFYCYTCVAMIAFGYVLVGFETHTLLFPQSDRIMEQFNLFHQLSSQATETDDALGYSIEGVLSNSVNIWYRIFMAPILFCPVLPIVFACFGDKRVGRIVPVRLSALFMAVGSALQFWCPVSHSKDVDAGPISLYLIGRIIQYCGLGVIFYATLFMVEILPANTRARTTGIMSTIFFALGFLFASLIPIHRKIEQHSTIQEYYNTKHASYNVDFWRIWTIRISIQTGLSLLWLLFLLKFVPESFRTQILRGRYEMAMSTIKRLRIRTLTFMVFITSLFSDNFDEEAIRSELAASIRDSAETLHLLQDERLLPNQRYTIESAPKPKFSNLFSTFARGIFIPFNIFMLSILRVMATWATIDYISRIFNSGSPSNFLKVDFSPLHLSIYITSILLVGVTILVSCAYCSRKSVFLFSFICIFVFNVQSSLILQSQATNIAKFIDMLYLLVFILFENNLRVYECEIFHPSISSKCLCWVKLIYFLNIYIYTTCINQPIEQRKQTENNLSFSFRWPDFHFVSPVAALGCGLISIMFIFNTRGVSFENMRSIF